MRQFGFATALSAAISVLLTGCMVGRAQPGLSPALPSAPTVAEAARPAASSAGPSQSFDVGAPVPSAWWRIFGSARLDRLVERALQANNDIVAADANLRQARELALAAGGARFPQVDLGYQAQRARTSAALSPPVSDPSQTLYTLQTAQVSASYTLDMFGGVRSRIASARAGAEVQRHRLSAARTTVVTNLIAAVVQHASLEAQLAAIETNIKINHEVLALMRRRQALGAIGAADVSAQETALAAAEAAAAPVRRDLGHQTSLISALTGSAPGTAALEIPRLDELRLPPRLPVRLPGEIVRQRPDVLAAESQMVGAAADLRTAIAARLPNITLSATAGGAASQFTRMLSNGNPFWSVVGGLTQPLFHGGALRHQQRASEAALATAEAQFRGAVVQAFVEVTDALSALHTDAEALDAAARGEAAAAQNLRFIRRQQRLGDVGTLVVLNAVAAHAQAELQVLQARAQRLSDSAVLVQALGGGWDHP